MSKCYNDRTIISTMTICVCWSGPCDQSGAIAPMYHIWLINFSSSEKMPMRIVKSCPWRVWAKLEIKKPGCPYRMERKTSCPISFPLYRTSKRLHQKCSRLRMTCTKSQRYYPSIHVFRSQNMFRNYWTCVTRCTRRAKWLFHWHFQNIIECTDRHSHARGSPPVEAPTFTAESEPQTTEYSYDVGSFVTVRPHDNEGILVFG